MRYVALNGSGNASFGRRDARAGNYRITYLGDRTHEPSVSVERRVYAVTTFDHAKIGGGLKATLRTVSGAAVPGRKVILQQRVSGSRKWVTVRSYKTNSKGQVVVRTNPPKRTDYRWTFNGDSTHRAATTRSVRLT